jgi:kynurenine formamidase
LDASFLAASARKRATIMRIRSFIIAYALVLAILLFADRRPNATQGNHYSHVVDLTGTSGTDQSSVSTRIIAPAALIPGTWSAGQIPAERLVAPLVVMDLPMHPDPTAQISLADVADWESRHGVVAQGALVAIRYPAGSTTRSNVPLPITADAAQFLMDARYVVGFVIESPSDLTSDRTLARQIALHGTYVVDGATRFANLSETGSLVIVAPAKNKSAAQGPVRILAMVR